VGVRDIVNGVVAATANSGAPSTNVSEVPVLAVVSSLLSGAEAVIVPVVIVAGAGAGAGAGAVVIVVTPPAIVVAGDGAGAVVIVVAIDDANAAVLPSTFFFAAPFRVRDCKTATPAAASSIPSTVGGGFFFLPRAMLGMSNECYLDE